MRGGLLGQVKTALGWLRTSCRLRVPFLSRAIPEAPALYEQHQRV
jgi:hypothetical protein